MQAAQHLASTPCFTTGGVIDPMLCSLSQNPKRLMLAHVPATVETESQRSDRMAGTWCASGTDVPARAGAPRVDALWIAVVLALFPVCAWYGGLKVRSRAGWMSFLDPPSNR
jgi:hypothetical protein